MGNYYSIKITYIPIIIWAIVAVIFTCGILLIVPLCLYFVLKNCKYYYDDEKLIVETGVFNKKQNIIPLYRIVNITALDNIFNYGNIYINDKEQTIVLKYVTHSKEEMLKLVDKWEKAKKENVRNEVI